MNERTNHAADPMSRPAKAGTSSLETSTDLSLDIAPGVTLNLALVPAGRFDMGSTEYSSSKPVHSVNIGAAYWIGRYPVTQEQYAAVMTPGAEQPKGFWDRVKRIGHARHTPHPSQFNGHPKNPVEMVSWHDAQDFCRRLSTTIGRPVMLPSEAQWEYACRAGTTTRFYVGDSESDLNRASWHSGNSGYRPHEVGQKEPNQWGLYDMHGNVWEWCEDWHSDNYTPDSPQFDRMGPPTGIHKVMRGGSWFFASENCTSAFRGYLIPGGKRDNVGFRVVVVDASDPRLVPQDNKGLDITTEANGTNHASHSLGRIIVGLLRRFVGGVLAGIAAVLTAFALCAAMILLVVVLDSLSEHPSPPSNGVPGQEIRATMMGAWCIVGGFIPGFAMVEFSFKKRPKQKPILRLPWLILIATCLAVGMGAIVDSISVSIGAFKPGDVWGILLFCGGMGGVFPGFIHSMWLRDQFLIVDKSKTPTAAMPKSSV